MISKTERPDA